MIRALGPEHEWEFQAAAKERQRWETARAMRSRRPRAPATHRSSRHTVMTLNGCHATLGVSYTLPAHLDHAKGWRLIPPTAVSQGVILCNVLQDTNQSK